MRMIFIAALLCATLTGCEDDKLKSENEELRSQVSRLREQLSDIREKAEALETSSATLRSEMDRFQSENWRDVVPDAEAASAQVQSDQSNLKSSADEAD